VGQISGNVDSESKHPKPSFLTCRIGKFDFALLSCCSISIQASMARTKCLLREFPEAAWRRNILGILRLALIPASPELARRSGRQGEEDLRQTETLSRHVLDAQDFCAYSSATSAHVGWAACYGQGIFEKALERVGCSKEVWNATLKAIEEHRDLSLRSRWGSMQLYAHQFRHHRPLLPGVAPD
jgi:hypothetical protein